MSVTESVYLDGVTADGTTAFVTRLARNVDEGVAWLWLHVFSTEGTFAFVRDDIPLVGGPTDESGDGAIYDLDSALGSARFERSGDAASPTGASVTVRLPGEGAELRATFSATGPAGSNLPGRTEVLGQVEATFTTDRGTQELRGLGQFHEQRQSTPRFTVPFTYGTLRGDELGLVFLIGPKASTAFVRTLDGVTVAREVRIDPVGDRRSLDLDLESGESLHLDVTRTHHYLLPIGGHPRESSIVVASSGGRSLSGCINDWQPPA